MEEKVGVFPVLLLYINNFRNVYFHIYNNPTNAQSVHPVVAVNKTFNITLVKSLSTDINTAM
jgi:hypothetical protein